VVRGFLFGSASRIPERVVQVLLLFRDASRTNKLLLLAVGTTKSTEEKTTMLPSTCPFTYLFHFNLFHKLGVCLTCPWYESLGASIGSQNLVCPVAESLQAYRLGQQNHWIMEADDHTFYIFL
jgi:hypothetical protein